jgi:hypothetical protein
MTMLRAIHRNVLAVATGVAGTAGLLGATSIGACGGTTGTPETPFQAPITPDPGSGPVDCNAGAGITFHVVEDFESVGSSPGTPGSATGLYTNTEYCYPCQVATAECLDSGTADVNMVGNAPNGTPLASLPTCSSVDLSACLTNCSHFQTSPSYLEDPLEGTLIPNGGRCGSLTGLNIVGGPFSNWGGSVGRRLSAPCASDPTRTCGFDASGYDGIALWMRTAPGSPGAPLGSVPRVIVGDQFTDTSYNQLLQQCGGPVIKSGCPDYLLPTNYCDPNPAPVTPTGMTGYSTGCDKFGSYATLTTNWQLVLLPFSEMRQGGWGRQQPQLDTSAIFSVEIDYTQGSWNFWIDDIAFYALNR